MLEDELLDGIAGALGFGGWQWHHARRSDLAKQMGTPGLPDIIAVRGGQLLAWELKAEKGHITHDQARWLAELEAVTSIDARVIRPQDYGETMLRDLLGTRLTKVARR